MPRIRIYEPAAGCATNACGPDGDAARTAFDEALEALERSGAEIQRFNLGHEPEEFSAEPAVKAALKASGMACLPMVFVDDSLLAQGRYPAQAELAGRTVA
jgi:hypothetical protein